ncbi:MAG: YhgE/Pip domain-containing protein [Lysinibacillus sp.]
MKEYKLFIAPFAAVLIVLLIFGSVLIPGAHSTPKQLPIGLVVEDGGEMGQSFATLMQENVPVAPGAKEPMIEWVMLESKEQMEEQMEGQSLYGALVIPADFTQKYASLQSPSPSAPALQLYINQGKNIAAATVVNQALTGIVGQMNAQMSNQLLSAMEQKNVPLSAEQARLFASPIQSSIEHVHETGNLSNAPLSFFQPIWLASVASAVLLWLAVKKRSFTSRAEQLKFRVLQVVLAILLGLLAGFTLPWITTWMLDYEFESYVSIALFLSISCMSFILMILAVMTWVGYAALPIFVLFMFYGLPLLQLAPEMMPAFYKEWIYPWLPMRFMFDGVKEILFFNGEVWNNGAVRLLWIAAVGTVLLLGKIFMPVRQESPSTEQEPVK